MDIVIFETFLWKTDSVVDLGKWTKAVLVWAVFLWAANKTLVISLAHEWLSLFPQSHVQHASKKVKLLKFVEKKKRKNLGI